MRILERAVLAEEVVTKGGCAAVQGVVPRSEMGIGCFVLSEAVLPANGGLGTRAPTRPSATTPSVAVLDTARLHD